jgi:hypothetical protein
VLFDPMKQQEKVNTVVGELVETWVWKEEGKRWSTT